MRRAGDCGQFEELLDGLVTGDRALSPGEQDFVDGHRGHCERCALSASLFEELGRAGDGAGPSEASLELQARRIVVEEEWRRHRARARRWRIAASLGPVAIVLTAAGAAVALSLAGVLPWTLERTDSVEPGEPGGIQPVPPPPAPVESPPVEPAPAGTRPEVTDTGDRPSAEPPRRHEGREGIPAGGGGSGVEIATAPEVALAETRSPPEGAEGGPPPSIEVLLDRARRARLDGDWAGSADAYGELIVLHEGTPEAATCLVSLGQLQLAQLDRPGDALESFRTYLAQTEQGPLAEEAGWGAAEALRRLGREGDERIALESLLASHPDGVYSNEARTRLGELGGGG